jgi:hypothetical protein
MFFKISAMRFSVSLGVLGLCGAVSAVPATASTLVSLNTGNGSSPYTISLDTLNPSEGTTVNVINPSELGGGWLNDLTSEWISPLTNQSNSNTSGEKDSGGVTYDVAFNLPSGFTAASLSITLLADDWATISLNNQSPFYTGSQAGQWTADNVVPVSAAVISELLPGTNTLQFVVANTGNGGRDAGGGPTGLDAQVSLSYTAVPEPSTWWLMALALAGGFAFRRNLGRPALARSRKVG